MNRLFPQESIACSFSYALVFIFYNIFIILVRNKNRTDFIVYCTCLIYLNNNIMNICKSNMTFFKNILKYMILFETRTTNFVKKNWKGERIKSKV